MTYSDKYINDFILNSLVLCGFEQSNLDWAKRQYSRIFEGSGGKIKSMPSLSLALPTYLGPGNQQDATLDLSLDCMDEADPESEGLVLMTIGEMIHNSVKAVAQRDKVVGKNGRLGEEVIVGYRENASVAVRARTKRRPTGDTLLVDIVDSGKGYTPEALARINQQVMKKQVASELEALPSDEYDKSAFHNAIKSMGPAHDVQGTFGIPGLIDLVTKWGGEVHYGNIARVNERGDAVFEPYWADGSLKQNGAQSPVWMQYGGAHVRIEVPLSVFTDVKGTMTRVMRRNEVRPGNNVTEQIVRSSGADFDTMKAAFDQAMREQQDQESRWDD